jgi:hypothetical protein
MDYKPKGRRYTREEGFDYYRNPMKYRKFLDKPKERQHDDYMERKRAELAPEKPMSGPLDEFITPDVFDYENCAKCHSAPRNDAWNIYCKECGGRGLLSL